MKSVQKRIIADRVRRGWPSATDLSKTTCGLAEEVGEFELARSAGHVPKMLDAIGDVAVFTLGALEILGADADLITKRDAWWETTLWQYATEWFRHDNFTPITCTVTRRIGTFERARRYANHTGMLPSLENLLLDCFIGIAAVSYGSGRQFAIDHIESIVTTNELRPIREGH